MLKIGQNWGKTVNDSPPPMLNKDRQLCLQIKFKPCLNVRSQNLQWGGGAVLGVWEQSSQKPLEVQGLSP